jgi:hypothetical protein
MTLMFIDDKERKMIASVVKEFKTKDLKDKSLYSKLERVYC